MEQLGSEEFSATLTAGSEPFYDFWCESCHEEGKYLEAKGFCQECNENLCSECIDIHQRTRLTKCHRITTDIPRVKPQPSPPSNSDQITTPCPQHGHRLIEYYCGNHKQLGCNVCMTVRHRNCNNVDYLLDIAQTFIDSEECDNVLSHLKAIDDRSQNILEEVQLKQIESDTHHTGVISTIQQARKEINDALDKAEMELEAAVNKEEKQNGIKLNQTATACADTSQAVVKILTDIHSLRDSRRFCQMFVEIKAVEKQIASLHTSLDGFDQNLKIRKAEFKANLKLKELLLYADALGTINVCVATGREPFKQDLSAGASNMRESQYSAHEQNREKTVSPNDMISQQVHNMQSTGNGQGGNQQGKPKQRHLSARGVIKQTDNDKTHSPSRQSAPVKDLKIIRAMHVTDIDVNTVGKLKSWLGRTSCTTTGMVALESNLIAITDVKNFKVKLVETLRLKKVVNELKVASSPSAITKVSNKVAVLLRDDKKILLISYSDDFLKVKKEITLYGRCKSIVAIDSDILVVYELPAKITLISASGTQKKTIFKDGGSTVFSLPNSIAVSWDQTLIYVSDYQKRTVTCLSLDGRVKDVYRASLMTPGAICVDKKGYVYVCDTQSNSIHLLTSDCKKVKILLQESDGLEDLLSLSYCGLTNRLYIGMKDSIYLRVFQLI